MIFLFINVCVVAILISSLQGLATELLDLVVSHAQAHAAEAVYLHVITYNSVAIAFYRRNHFIELSLLRGFYYIASGRQPDPSTTSYDALLFSLQLAMPREAQTLWGMLRSLLQQPSLVCCGPWVKRRRVHKYQGNASLCQSVPLIKGQHSDKTSTERPSALGRMFGRVRAD